MILKLVKLMFIITNKLIVTINEDTKLMVSRVPKGKPMKMFVAIKYNLTCDFDLYSGKTTVFVSSEIIPILIFSCLQFL